MAQKQVSATRITLLSYKKQKKVAETGHKLLKDKRDGLMQEFLTIIRQAKDLRTEVEQALSDANKFFLKAQSKLHYPVLKNILSVPFQTLELEVKTKNVMSVQIPQFKAKVKGNPLSYGKAQNSAELDIALLNFAKVFELMIQLAEIEKSAENLAVEIEKTRRRVNALEYHLIPEIEASLKFIKMKLAEAERDAIVQVMAIKNMIETQEASKKAKALAALETA